MHQRLGIFRNIKDAHFQITNECNLACIYCSAYKQKEPIQSMPFEIAQKYIDLIFENSCSPDIGLLFYGGEALLQKLSWFEDVTKYATEQAKKYSKNLHFLMQSNIALPLNDETLAFLKKNQIVTGTSLDGPSKIHNLTRGNFSLVMKNIQKLKEIGCFGGVICTINEFNYDKTDQILEFFEEKDINWVALNTVYSIGRGYNLVPLDEDVIFLVYKSIYDYTEKTKGKRVIEGNMAERLIKYIYPPNFTDFKETLMCNYPFCGGGITIIICDMGGDLYPCGCSNMTNDFRLGNIHNISEDIYMKNVRRFHTKNEFYYEECQYCDAVRICNFSCTGFQAIDKSTAKSECIATKMLFSYLKKKKIGILKEIVQNLKTGREEYDWHIKSLSKGDV